jgi:hypothetical protein
MMNDDLILLKKKIGTMKTKTIIENLVLNVEKIKTSDQIHDHENLISKIETITKTLIERGFEKHHVLLAQENLLRCIICDSQNLRVCNRCSFFICECGHHTEFFKNGGREWKLFNGSGFCVGDCLHKKENTKVVDRKENYITIKTTCLNCGYFHYANVKRR